MLFFSAKKLFADHFLPIWTTNCTFFNFAHFQYNICCREVKEVLPEMVGMLPNDDTNTDLPTEVTASLCHILINLSQSSTQYVRAIVNQGALPKIINISKDSGLVCPHLTHTPPISSRAKRTLNLSCSLLYPCYMYIQYIDNRE